MLVLLGSLSFILINFKIDEICFAVVLKKEQENKVKENNLQNTKMLHKLSLNKGWFLNKPSKLSASK